MVKSTSDIAIIFAKESGNIGWRALLSGYIETSHFPDKYYAIDNALRANPDKFEEILGILLKEHHLNSEKITRLNEVIKPKGYYVTNRGLLIQSDPEIGITAYLRKLYIWFQEVAHNTEGGEKYLKDFDFHAQNVNDSFLVQDWKKFSSEERNLLETIIKALSDHDIAEPEFNMKDSLERYFGSKKWQVDILYGIYRMLSEQGSHAGIPDKLLCHSAYKLLRDSSEAIFKINRAP